MIREFRRSMRRTFRSRSRGGTRSGSRIVSDLKSDMGSPSRHADNSNRNNNNLPESATKSSLSRFTDDTPIDTTKCPEWQEDERQVRSGQCNFKVKFVGYIEVKDPRGMPVCEEAVKELQTMKKTRKKFGSSSATTSTTEPPIERGILARLSLRSRSRRNRGASMRSDGEPSGINVEGELVTGPSGKKHKLVGKKAVLWVSPDSLRVVEEKKKTMLVDQTIEKVSFCAPDRTFHKSFSYICRDGTTRKWWCYSFKARGKVNGERLSHAVGCAFNACLKRKLDLERIANEKKADDPEDKVGENAIEEPELNPVVRSATEPVIQRIEKVIVKQHSQFGQEKERERAELTSKLVDEKFPELRSSMRSRTRGRRVASKLNSETDAIALPNAGTVLTTSRTAQELTPNTSTPPRSTQEITPRTPNSLAHTPRASTPPPQPAMQPPVARPAQPPHTSPMQPVVHATNPSPLDPLQLLQPIKTVEEILNSPTTPTRLDSGIAPSNPASSAWSDPWASQTQHSAVSVAQPNLSPVAPSSQILQPTRPEPVKFVSAAPLLVAAPLTPPSLQPKLSSNNPFLQDSLSGGQSRANGFGGGQPSSPGVNVAGDTWLSEVNRTVTGQQGSSLQTRLDSMLVEI